LLIGTLLVQIQPIVKGSLIAIASVRLHIGLSKVQVLIFAWEKCGRVILLLHDRMITSEDTGDALVVLTLLELGLDLVELKGFDSCLRHLLLLHP
jgi:hypothetical protein